jgi:hypothetical protein
LNAIRCYEDALEKDWSVLDEDQTELWKIEHELWEQSLLRCYKELTDWKSICDRSTNDTSLSELFNDSYSLDHIFPYAFKSKLKLILQENESEQKKHGDLLKFIQDLDLSGKRYLEQNYSQDLSLIYLHQNDFNASKYYAQMTMEKYLQVSFLKHLALLIMRSMPPKSIVFVGMVFNK